MYCDRWGNGQKPTRTKTSAIEFVQRTFVRDFCTRPIKNWGGPRCVTYFQGGVPGCVTKCDRGGGDQNSVTYFMDDPRLDFLRYHFLPSITPSRHPFLPNDTKKDISETPLHSCPVRSNNRKYHMYCISQRFYNLIVHLMISLCFAGL